MAVFIPRLVHHTIQWCLSICITLMITQLTAQADQLTFQLDEIDDKAEYQRLFLRMEGQDYDYSDWVYQGSNQQVTIENLEPGVKYNMVARSYAANIQSANSNEVSFLLPEGDRAQDAKVWIEAEDGDISSPMQIENGDADSSGAFIIVPNGSGDNYNADVPSGSVAYHFEVPVSGAYTIWGRVLAPAGSDDSFWVSMDNEAPILWDAQRSTSWIWDRVSSRDGADPATFLLTAGSHTLVFNNREDGVCIDKILITNESDYLPTAFGEPLEIPDSDGDGINDQEEVDLYGTDPGNQDSDGDGIDDGQELELWADAWDADQDGDGIINLLDPDADNDGVTDGDELFEGTDPLIADIPEVEVGPVHIWMEAEDADISSPMQIESGNGNCSGDYVVTPNGSGSNYADLPGGNVTFQFEVPVTGTYTIWGRVLAPSSGDDSFWVSMDNGASMLWDIQRSTSWSWDKVRDRDMESPTVFELTAGPHTLVFKNREDGTAIDNILITNDPDYVPDGSGEQSEGFVKVWVEAENGNIDSPMQIETGNGNNSGNFVITPNGTGNNYDANTPSGSVELQFEVPVSGTYTVWGRVLAPTSGDDSFWVSMDNGASILWDTQRSTSWSWDKVRDRDMESPTVFELTAGPHTLVINNREDGTAIDNILITNDPEYLPEELVEQPEVPMHIWMEAEDGLISNPMQIEAGNGDSSGNFVISPNGSGNYYDAGMPAGRIELQFEAPVSGTYTVWGRVLAPTGGDDSFWVSMDDGIPMLWDTQRSTNWLWDTVKDRNMAAPAVFELTAGNHTIVFKTREDGAAIDQVLITIDPDYVPE